MIHLIGIVILALLIGAILIAPVFFPGSLPAGTEKDLYVCPRDSGIAGWWTGNALSYYAQHIPFHETVTKWCAEARKQGKKGFVWKVFMFRHAVHVIEPKDAQYILVGNSGNFQKPSVVYSGLEIFLGKRSILNILDEKEHKKVRLIVNNALNAHMARDVYGATIMPPHITQFCDHLEEECKNSGNGATTAHFRLTEELAAGVMLEAAYRNDRVDTKQPDGIVEQFRKLQNILGKDYALLVGIPAHLRWIVRMFSSHAGVVLDTVTGIAKKIDSITVKLIQEASKVDDADKDHDRSLIDVMMRAQKGDPEDPTAYKPTNEDVVSNCSLLSFAGTETTSRTIYWTMTQLAHHPEIQETLFEELEDIVSPNAAPVFEDVANLKFLEACVKETLRVIPPIPAIPRIALKDDVLPSGLKIPAGTEMGIAFANFHHNQDVWGDDALEWRPSRWEDEKIMARVKQSPCNWFPFALGPRNCVGKDVAVVEIVIAIAAVVRRFKIERADPKQKFPMPFVALAVRPDVPSPLKFVRRE